MKKFSFGRKRKNNDNFCKIQHSIHRIASNRCQQLQLEAFYLHDWLKLKAFCSCHWPLAHDRNKMHITKKFLFFVSNKKVLRISKFLGVIRTKIPFF